MKFKELLEFYEDKISYIKRCAKKRYFSLEYIKGYMSCLNAVFRRMKLECPEVLNLEIKYAAAAAATAEDDSKDDIFGFLEYRGVHPVYLDDYGQCFYIKFENKEFSGGTFNSYPELEFSDFIDDCLYMKTLKEIEVAAQA